MQLEKICLKVIESVRKTGRFILTERKNITREDIELKGPNDFVTYVDKTAEKLLVEYLLTILPDAGFITEEGTSTKKGVIYNWIIDPLDGTVNYIHGISPFAVSVGLKKDDRIILGVVYELSLNEIFYSWENAPAYLNGKEIRVSSNSGIDTALFATGFPPHQFDKMNQQIEVLKELIPNTAGVRRLGSAATDLVYVAAGRFEVYFEVGLKPWDVAAGAFILQQAGGKVTDFNGNNNWLFSGQIVAGNTLLFEEFFNVVNEKLGAKSNNKAESL